MKFKNAVVQLLCPFGKWPHEKGMQIVDCAAAGKLVENFRASGLLGRGIKCPIFFGHPDDAPWRAFHRPKPVGAVEGIAQIDGGIAVLCSYDDKAYGDIISGRIKRMSPRWRMEDIGNGSYRPEKLISIGLTNNPNIPDSGKILKAQWDYCIGGVSSLRFRTEKLAEKAAACAKKAEKICSSMARGRNAEPAPGRLSARVPPGGRDIVAIARERMKLTGLPYTRCFAEARREII